MSRTKKNVVKISDYINTRYRDYSIYTNNDRAIPSIIDGFKAVQRKIIYAAIKECANDFVKLSALGGVLAKVSAYHHGNVSAENAIIKMAQDFNQNIPLLDYEGTFGTRPVPDAGAARYIFVKLGENFEKIFKDNDILPQSLDKDDHPEPLYYLPIIPTVLLNGAKGMAVGFAVNILPRSIVDITESCINYVSKGKVLEVMPNLTPFRGTFEKVGPSKFICKGVLEHERLNIYRIKELPLKYVHEKYVSHLDTLVEKGVIKKYDDDTSDIFDFKIHAARGVTQEHLERELKLAEPITENISLIEDFNQTGEDGMGNIKIKSYDCIEDVIKTFCDFRIGFYNYRIQHNLKKLNDQILLKNAKIDFINDVLNNKINIRNVTRKQLHDDMVKKGYDTELVTKIISIPVYTMTKDNIEKLQREVASHKKDIDWWNKQTAKKLYLKDLRDLLKEYK
jgi:DNA gyrase/topoisomerase IV subunit A